MPDPGLVVVSNTSPLLYLHCIDKLGLLESLYGDVHVPQQVVDELAAGSKAGYPVPDLRSLPWARVRQVVIPPHLASIPGLGSGEASALALAMEAPGATLLLLDDSLARRIAVIHRLRFTGTAGVLLRARERGLVSRVKPLLEAMQKAGFYLRPRDMEMVCRVAGE